ncbi:hypothetical protein evm_014780, partial [Chilo suppressalis]
MNGIGRLDHAPPRGPSADWRVLTTADAAGTNGLTCLPKHGGTRDRRFLDLSQLVMERTCVMSSILPPAELREPPPPLDARAHRTLHHLTSILHAHLQQIRLNADEVEMEGEGAEGGAGEEGGEAWAGGERISLRWPNGSHASLHVVIAHAHLKLLCYGPSVYDTNQEMYSWLQSVWVGKQAPGARLEAGSEAALLPDWLRLHLVRSARPALLDAGLRALPAHKLALFIQTFGMPAGSEAALLPDWLRLHLVRSARPALLDAGLRALPAHKLALFIQTFGMPAGSEAALLPDWLRLHLVRSARPALLDAGLRALPAHKLALFIQTFGMPAGSEAALLPDWLRLHLVRAAPPALLNAGLASRLPPQAGALHTDLSACPYIPCRGLGGALLPDWLRCTCAHARPALLDAGLRALPPTSWRSSYRRSACPYIPMSRARRPRCCLTGCGCTCAGLRALPAPQAGALHTEPSHAVHSIRGLGAALLPDWLRLHLVRSAAPRCWTRPASAARPQAGALHTDLRHARGSEAALLLDWLRLALVRRRPAPPLPAAHKLALFIRRFGMPVHSNLQPPRHPPGGGAFAAALQLQPPRHPPGGGAFAAALQLQPPRHPPGGGAFAAALQLQPPRHPPGGGAFAAALQLQPPRHPPDDMMFADEELPAEVSDPWEAAGASPARTAATPALLATALQPGGDVDLAQLLPDGFILAHGSVISGNRGHNQA